MISAKPLQYRRCEISVENARCEPSKRIRVCAFRNSSDEWGESDFDYRSPVELARNASFIRQALERRLCRGASAAA